MDDFLPPPGFTTVRYDSNTIQLESARKALEKVVSEVTVWAYPSLIGYT